MKTPPPCELRDPDGSYALVQPFDEVRCRVIASNVAQKDQVLYKGGLGDWRDAAEDLGGFTRLGPCEILGPADPEELEETEERGEFAREDGRPSADRLDLVEDPRYSKINEQAIDADLRVAILRLAIHFRQVHERNMGRSRWMKFCRCPRYAPDGAVLRARLHSLVWVALLTEQLPSLPRIRAAIRAVSPDQAELA